MEKMIELWNITGRFFSYAALQAYRLSDINFETQLTTKSL